MRSLAIPPGWQVRRLKFASTINDEALPESTPPDLGISYVDIGDVTSEGQITGATVYRFEQAPSRARRKVRDGDVIVSTVRTYLRAIAPIHDPEPNLIVSTGFAVVRPTILDTSFAAYALRAPYFVDRVVAASTGVSYPAINASTLGDLPVLVPPLTTQRAIAAFLDRETAKIDALIEKKRRLLDLLDEEGAALITRAVTRGLDADAPMKDSGVEWLGEIPVHWKVVRLSYVAADLQTGPFGTQLGSDDYVNNEVPVINPRNLSGGRLTADQSKTVPSSIAVRLSRYKLRPGDLVFARRGDLGRCAVVGPGEDGWLCGTGCVRARLKESVLLPDYLWYFSMLRGFRGWLEDQSVGSTMDNLNTGMLGRARITVPPVEEQRYIVRHVTESNNRLARLTRLIHHAIALLQEYRTALISAAVTGQIDIPDAAA